MNAGGTGEAGVEAKKSKILRPRADWGAVLRALYAPVAGDAAWTRGVADAIAPTIRGSEGVGFYLFEQIERPRLAEWWGYGRAAGIAMSQAELDAFTPQMARMFLAPPELALTHAMAERDMSAEERAMTAEMRRRFDIQEALGLVGQTEPGSSFALAIVLDRPTILEKHERRVLAELTLHLESALRLRRRPELVRAIVAPDGKVLHREHGPWDEGRAREQVRAIEATRARRAQPIIDVWSALVNGEVSLVERVEGSRRAYFVLENPPSRRKHRALSHREIEVLRMAARGLSLKLVAYGLGLSSALVSNSLRSAAMKLGFGRRLDLLRVAASLTSTTGKRVDAGALTETEREVFELVQSGLSNREIATRRARSVRTVANQVAAILRKTDSPTRRALVHSRLKARV